MNGTIPKQTVLPYKNFKTLFTIGIFPTRGSYDPKSLNWANFDPGDLI